jgi:hypothetical protein
MRLTQRVRQQIKHLILWRSTFYVADFLRQRPMLSFKELQRLYLLFCALCNTVCGMLPQQELVLRTNALSFPMAKARGCRAFCSDAELHVLLVQYEQRRGEEGADAEAP